MAWWGENGCDLVGDQVSAIRGTRVQGTSLAFSSPTTDTGRKSYTLHVLMFSCTDAHESRRYREHDLRAAQDLSEFILSKASPPYFMGSPPVRATNPLVHDAQFCAWKVHNVDQSIGIPIPAKSYNARYCAGTESFTKA
ncbi:unnamed protein product [Miscanthus lutarioriparius]|uniref:Uncharacterized protein n=1 Tax=Miscanthus lutarioriparius TaxID=422564 RepID=A0A811SDZ7_9POAL|nr:unnamed protein product [Miscanthus lutarioriparius]